MLRPRNVPEVRTFITIINYYSKLLHNNRFMLNLIYFTPIELIIAIQYSNGIQPKRKFSTKLRKRF